LNMSDGYEAIYVEREKIWKDQHVWKCFPNPCLEIEFCPSGQDYHQE